jgi:hypothetical protein
MHPITDQFVPLTKIFGRACAENSRQLSLLQRQDRAADWTSARSTGTRFVDWTSPRHKMFGQRPVQVGQPEREPIRADQ